jgi:predicted negative regulator of RcsB-dependent stress response
MDHLLRNRKEILLWIGGVAALLLLIYGVSLMNGFVVWDDALLVVNNPIAHGLTWMNIKAAFTSYDPELYIPLTFLSFQINYALGGLAPFGYHLGNLLLHFGSVLLVAWAIFGITKNRATAIITALLFAVHPINVEAVAWVSGRKDVLAAFFFLLALRAFIKKEEADECHPERVEGWLWYGISIGAFLLGLLAKVSIVTLPFALLLIDWYRKKPITKKTWIELAPFFLLSVLFAIIASIGKVSSDVFFFEKFLMGCLSIVLHLWHVIFPVGFSVLYPYTEPLSLLTPDILGSVILVIGMLIGAWIIRKKTRAPLFALLWFILLLGPSMTNIAKGHNELLDVYVTSDRYAYLPVISIFLLFGLGYSWIREWIARKPELNFTAFGSASRLVNLLLVVVIGTFGFLSFDLSRTWHDTVTLFTQTIKHHKNAYVAYTNLGAQFYQAGQVDMALEYFNKSLAIRQDATTLFNVGVIERQQGKIQEALQHFIAAAKSSLIDPSPRIAIATMLVEDGQWKNAEDFLRKAVAEVAPSSQLYQTFGMVLEQNRKPAEAREAYRKAVQLDPQNTKAKERLKALGG